MPQNEPVRGRYLFVGDIRLDNAAELAARLDLSPTATEAEIVVAAYHRWGGDICCHDMLGDFAFAIWDRNEHRLLIARDHIGVRPLFYVLRDESIAFASEPSALGVPLDAPLEGRRLISYLAGLAEYGEEAGPNGLRRVMPGHTLVWQAGQYRTHRYWELAPDLTDSTNPAERFREIFIASVRARIADAQSVAAMLSGGLDSSAISTVAAPISERPLPTYSIIYPEEPPADESRFIKAVLRKGGFRPVKIDLSKWHPLQDIEAAMGEQYGPFLAPGLTKSSCLYRRAAADGMKILLDGHGGDEVVWHGGTRLLELAAEGRWLHALALLRTSTRASGEDPLKILVLLLRLHASGSRAGRLLRRVGTQLLQARGMNTSSSPAWRRYLRPEALRIAAIAERYVEVAGISKEISSSDRANHLRALTQPSIPAAFEVLDRASAAAGIEARYPFYDRRLVTFCLGLPASEKLRLNQTRSILRRGLAADLPPSVRRRQDKTNFLPHFAKGLVARHREALEELLAQPDDRIAECVNMNTLRDDVAALLRNPDALNGAEIMMIWRILCVHLWHRQDSRCQGCAA
ncbi:asparagine synthase-related protein [Roseitranquillus sediminis]|uniref:asparagine synthase-related protein n=1 Tax=Roseitranquillus sediminis TaxID=2809051 RepID=UPI001D0CDA06|nr:asparagine synthase-related protein [Roseitranquillus sediminis]MBM9594025.1 asparagine synthetase B [Roseitranquillus sediminis]